MTDIKSGDKVYYTAPHGKKENGMVKEVRDKIAFVVYHCGGEWDKFRNFTGAATDLQELRKGWVDDKGQLLKEYCDHHYIPSASKWEPINRRTCIYCNDTID